MDEVEQQGWDDRLHDLSFSDNPYPRRTEAFSRKRAGTRACNFKISVIILTREQEGMRGAKVGSRRITTYGKAPYCERQQANE